MGIISPLNLCSYYRPKFAELFSPNAEEIEVHRILVKF